MSPPKTSRDTGSKAVTPSLTPEEIAGELSKPWLRKDEGDGYRGIGTERSPGVNDFDPEPPILPDEAPAGEPPDWARTAPAEENKSEPVKPAGKRKPETGSGFNFKTLGELMEEPEVPIDWLLDGLLVRGTVSLLAAKPKTGKSVFARGLALAVAQGRSFLGRTTNQGGVLYLCLEERQQDVRRDFERMGATGSEPLSIAEMAAPGIPGLCARFGNANRH